MRKVLWCLCRLLSVSLLLWTNVCFAGIDFDGVDDFVNVSSVWNATQDYSIFIVARKEEANRTQGVYANTQSWGDFGIACTSGNILRHSTFGYADHDSNITWNINKWVAIVITGDKGNSSSGLTFYYRELDSSTITTYNRSWDDRGDTKTVAGYIGRNQFGEYFNGQIAEVCIWGNRLLMDAQARQLLSSYSKGFARQMYPADIKEYWLLDDQPDGTSGDGDTFKDISGNGKNGTGDNGGNNTGLAMAAEQVLSYPDFVQFVNYNTVVAAADVYSGRGVGRGVGRGIMR